MSPIVISLGGSLVAPPSGIDTAFLKEFRDLMLKEIAAGRRFIFIVGGGSTARAYMRAANEIAPLESDDMDWLGIHATRINGHLLRTVFRDVAHPIMIKNPMHVVRWTKPVLVAAGWKPGWSTDYIAVRLAKRFHAQEVINLSNIERVYDQDPAKFPHAKPFDRLDWPTFRGLVGDTWSPGSNAPFDPVASKLAQRCHMKVIIARGTDLKNLKKILDGKKFVGTSVE